jgi:hypothetical protein
MLLDHAAFQGHYAKDKKALAEYRPGAGLWKALDGHVLIFIHKEKELACVERFYPAKHFVVCLVVGTQGHGG